MRRSLRFRWLVQEVREREEIGRRAGCVVASGGGCRVVAVPKDTGGGECGGCARVLLLGCGRESGSRSRRRMSVTRGRWIEARRGGSA